LRQIIVGIGEHVAFPVQHETGVQKISADGCRVDPVGFLHHGTGIARQSGMVDHGNDAARFHAHIKVREHRRRIHLLELILFTFPVKVMVDQVHHGKIDAVGCRYVIRQLRSHHRHIGLPLGHAGPFGPGLLAGGELRRIDGDNRSARTDRAAHDFTIIAAPGKNIEHAVPGFESHEGEHFCRLPAFVQLDVCLVPAGIGDRSLEVGRHCLCVGRWFG